MNNLKHKGTIPCLELGSLETYFQIEIFMQKIH